MAAIFTFLPTLNDRLANRGRPSIEFHFLDSCKFAIVIPGSRPSQALSAAKDPAKTRSLPRIQSGVRMTTQDRNRICIDDDSSRTIPSTPASPPAAPPRIPQPRPTSSTRYCCAPDAGVLDRRGRLSRYWRRDSRRGYRAPPRE